MIRPTLSLLLTSCLLAACGGPIETRVETQAAATLTENMTYRFTEKPEQSSEIYQSARKIVGDVLNRKGLRSTPDSEILVQLSIAERPASIGITSGEKDTERDVAIQKKKKLLQSCDDVEHRFSISLIEELGGNILYQGQAAEFHCKGRLDQSLAPLINEALSDLGKGTMVTPRKTIKKRTGIE